MSLKKDVENNVKKNRETRFNDKDNRPLMEVWPSDDDFGHWVAYHEAKERGVICNTPEFKDTPFCGSGHH